MHKMCIPHSLVIRDKKVVEWTESEPEKATQRYINQGRLIQNVLSYIYSVHDSNGVLQ